MAGIKKSFKFTEPDFITIFVTRQLNKLPLIILDHLNCSKILKDMVTLKAEIEEKVSMLPKIV